MKGEYTNTQQKGWQETRNKTNAIHGHLVLRRDIA